MFSRMRFGAVTAVLVLVAGFTIAACGSSSSSSSAGASSAGAGTTTTSTGTSTTAGRGGFASLTTTQRSCLKAKGVTLPTGGAHGFGGAGGTGTFTRPAGGFGGGAPAGGTSTTGAPGGRPGGFGGAPGASTKFAAAFKACGVSFGGGFHGGFGAGGRTGAVSSTAIKAFVACVDQHGYTVKNVNTSGQGAVLPASLQKNAKFLAAAKSCTSLLRRGGTAGGTATTASS
jgi:hypothetical protein